MTTPRRRIARAKAKAGERKWMAGAVKHPGALHESLGVPQGQKIPAEMLQPKPGDSGLTRKRKALARTFRRY